MMNHINQFKCHFCQKVCLKLHRERKRHWWWECISCNTHFLANLKGTVEITKFKTEGKEKFYSLELNWKTKVSSLDQWEQRMFSISGKAMFRLPEYNCIPLMKFPNIIPNVTPQNATDKMKLYLLFS